MGEDITISTADGPYSAYLTRPPTGKGPGLLVLPEIYNSNDHIRGIADRFAEEGYVTLAPDVFWRIQPNCYFPYTDAGQAEARSFNQQLNVDQLVMDLGHAIHFLRSSPFSSGLVGSVGFCLGGKLSYLCAARLQVEVAVSYYGVKIEDYLEESDNIKCPMTLHFAGNDPRVPPMARAKIESKFVGKHDVNVYLYPNAEHGFNRVGYPPYHEVSARLALERTLNLFQSNLFPQSK